ncbi:MAG: exodeoxyribonuclease VII small subunit [Clostridiales bacterium]|nr:exodeoxyribonuclease VII small subunit [Clostridiales bacterium]
MQIKWKDNFMAKQAKTLEQTFEQLEAVMEELEKEEISLEDSFRLYQEGMKLLKECNDSIDKVEKKLMILEEGQEG